MNLSEVSNRIKLFADGIDHSQVEEALERYNVKGFTTNPSLMKKLGVTNYEHFAKDFMSKVEGYPVSFEVFADDLGEMERQAEIISNWGENVYVKIPIMNTEGVSTSGLIKKLSDQGVKINTTAVFTEEQIDGLRDAYNKDVPSILSVFSGRIADAGVDPNEIVQYAVEKFKDKKNVEILWASTREVYNILEAINSKADIITAQSSILKKLDKLGKNLTEFSQDTVKMFRNDALSSGYEL